MSKQAWDVVLVGPGRFTEVIHTSPTYQLAESFAANDARIPSSCKVKVLTPEGAVLSTWHPRKERDDA